MNVDLQSLENIPRHVALIMDGNGRWAREHGLSRIEGHKEGAQSVRAVLRAAARAGVEYLTVYAFSTENWKRPKLEVEFLMKLLSRYLDKELPTYIELGVKFEMIGDMTRFSPALQNQIKQLEEDTKHGSNLIQHLALNYGSRNEILRAVNSLKDSEMITEESLNNALD